MGEWLPLPPTTSSRERPSWNPPMSSRAKWTTQLMVLNKRFRSRLIVRARASPSSMWSKRISMILCGTTTSWSTGGWLMPIISKMYLAAPRGMGMNHYMEMNQMRQMDWHQKAMGRNQVDMYGSQQLENLKGLKGSLKGLSHTLKQFVASRGTQGGQSIPVSNTQQGGTQLGGTQQGANMNPLNQIDQVIDGTLNEAIKHINIGI